MAFLTLKGIGKIYVSEGNVAVGIRGVDLSFERGEFVAVTGKSGSGKSTLLNVISGIDTYEEGELFVAGEPTSHYLQPDWEAYREKYISFIFQDYNIIESFTVLQNVELALLHIEDKKARRARAMELLRRVGLEKQVKQKGSRLSGGQKQRTVIARALAKDSPIILADEPTGNLDSVTSREIIELLAEVSRDKLLIVVTHDFEQVEAHATRHVRIFDGAVESDHKLRPTQEVAAKEEKTEPKPQKQKTTGKKRCKDGLVLGKAIFLAKPRLSLFLCLLMIIGTLGIFMITTLCGEAGDLFAPNYMFRHMDGRVIITTKNGVVLSEDEVAALAQKHGAASYLRYDVLLDDFGRDSLRIPAGSASEYDTHLGVEYTYGERFGDVIGRYPEKDNEVLLYLPISYASTLGREDAPLVDTVYLSNMSLKLVGVKYYYDNNLTPRCLLTETGFRTVTAAHYLTHRADANIRLSVADKKGEIANMRLSSLIPVFGMEEGKICILSNEYESLKKQYAKDGITTTINYSAVYYKYDYRYDTNGKSYAFERVFTDKDIAQTVPEAAEGADLYGGTLAIDDALLREIAETTLAASYRQASLFFDDDAMAKNAAEALKADGYIAVPSYTTYSPDALQVIENVIACAMMAVVWVVSVIFLAFFINLCTTRTLDAFKGDMAIMRSMGIPVTVIRVGMYTRMLISLIPAFILVGLSAFLIFTSPKFNEYFVYLYAWQYALIFLGMLILTLRITYKQVKRLFGESVKKSLKGGNAE